MILHRIADLRTAVAAWRRDGVRVAVVPTMGALHEGHLSLIRAAAASADRVIATVFVNPTQFNDPADLAAYPRTLDADADAAVSAGADVVFAPDIAEMYPDGFSTSVHVGGVSAPWEGANRGASHFDGVALVVTKLLLIAGADDAWFGAKDAQQVAVVRRVVADLHIPTRVRVLPTIRNEDGLALSSRNVRLRPQDRAQALSLSASLRAAASRAAAGETDASALAEAGRRMVEAEGAVVEYWAIVDPVTFETMTDLGNTDALAIVAARVGDVRLIDNAPIPARDPEED